MNPEEVYRKALSAAMRIEAALAVWATAATLLWLSLKAQGVGMGTLGSLLLGAAGALALAAVLLREDGPMEAAGKYFEANRSLKPFSGKFHGKRLELLGRQASRTAGTYLRRCGAVALAAWAPFTAVALLVTWIGGM